MLPENKAENDNSPQKPHNKYSEDTSNLLFWVYS